MQSELKPCPFCGGDAEYHSDKGPTGEVYAWVGCNQCDAMSVHCDVRSMQPEETHPIDAWNTRAEASSAEPVVWMYWRDGRDVILRERLHRDGILQGVTGWTETPLYTHPPAAPDTVTLDRALVEEVLGAFRLLRSYGCLECSGDCASANPPMIICPMADGQAAIFKLTRALK